MSRVRHLHMWHVSPGETVLSAHILTIGEHAVLRDLEHQLASSYGTTRTTLQIEPTVAVR
nr:hypothetical protein [Streptomyces sp. CG 926]